MWTPRSRSPRSVFSSLSPTKEEIPTGTTMAIEGNIGVGKSTFLHVMNSVEKFKGSILTIPEPVEKWQNVAGSKHNLLGEFYKDAKRFSYTFQSYAFITRFLQHNEGVETHPHHIRILERTVFTDRKVFVSSLHEQGLMSDMERHLYNEWFDPVVDTLPNLIPDIFVYLRASPKACLERLQSRSRSEESSISLEYLENLHTKHEDWLIGETTPARVTNENVMISGKKGDPLGEETMPGLWLRLFLKDKEFTQLSDRVVIIIDCEKNCKSVDEESFKVGSLVPILKCCGVHSLNV